ncbi:hypothetical protein [Winslowiella iniecta]|uniref:Uncharacterized protein n=1 Tax=Winslowiella iniecta TaxID=1560201 RepID=A0A0L7SY84_9GAMM|nr:hypothetical protein [Winslowiella iniecta]KOC87530.1 hypothetical protein NG42_20225 [Winslowiella iniecta]KOC88109.1 hypothetical protein NG43_20810 [Winslowiella iniecta]
MSYTTTPNYNKIASQQPKKKGRPRKIRSKQEPKSDELKIEKVYSESPSLTEMEKETISEILDNTPGVYFKPRNRCITIIYAPEKWHMIHNSREEFEFWCIYNRIGSPHFDGYSYQEMMNQTSEWMT